MLQYAQDIATTTPRAAGRGGVLFWYELLHELVWGAQTGLQTIEFGGMYEAWKGWFEQGGEAPRFGGVAAA